MFQMGQLGVDMTKVAPECPYVEMSIMLKDPLIVQMSASNLTLMQLYLGELNYDSNIHLLLPIC